MPRRAEFGRAVAAVARPPSAVDLAGRPRRLAGSPGPPGIAGHTGRFGRKAARRRAAAPSHTDGKRRCALTAARPRSMLPIAGAVVVLLAIAGGAMGDQGRCAIRTPEVRGAAPAARRLPSPRRPHRHGTAPNGSPSGMQSVASRHERRATLARCRPVAGHEGQPPAPIRPPPPPRPIHGADPPVASQSRHDGGDCRRSRR